MKTIRALRGLALATFVFGLAQPGMAQSFGERNFSSFAVPPSSALRGQERSIPASPFQGRAEYPPPGYLAEFEDTRGGRATRAERELTGEFAPLSPGIVPGSPSRNPPGPDFAPGGYDLRAPSPQLGGREYAPPGDQRWSSRPGTSGHEPSWPNAPSARYSTRPGFVSENLEPGRHERAPGPNSGAPAYPPQNTGWPY